MAHVTAFIKLMLDDLDFSTYLSDKTGIDKKTIVDALNNWDPANTTVDATVHTTVHTTVNTTTNAVNTNKRQEPFELVDYTELSVLVKGDTKTIKDDLKSLGGSWNKTLDGWIFSKKKKNSIIDYMNSHNLQYKTVGNVTKKKKVLEESLPEQNDDSTSSSSQPSLNATPQKTPHVTPQKVNEVKKTPHTTPQKTKEVEKTPHTTPQKTKKTLFKYRPADLDDVNLVKKLTLVINHYVKKIGNDDCKNDGDIYVVDEKTAALVNRHMKQKFDTDLYFSNNTLVVLKKNQWDSMSVLVEGDVVDNVPDVWYVFVKKDDNYVVNGVQDETGETFVLNDEDIEFIKSNGWDYLSM